MMMEILAESGRKGGGGGGGGNLGMWLVLFNPSGG